MTPDFEGKCNFFGRASLNNLQKILNLSFEICLSYWMEYGHHLIRVKLGYFLILAAFAIIYTNSFLCYM